MQNLGFTRSVLRKDHALLTPDTFVRAPLPGMQRATAIIHTSPAGGAAFTQYTAELETGGSLGPPAGQRFVYVLGGELRVEAAGVTSILRPNGYAYLSADHAVEAFSECRVAVIEKRYIPLAASPAPPPSFTGDERAVAGQPLGGDSDLEVRSLIPADAAFDFAINTMTYQPGAALSMVEVHVMEHGLLMLDGGGIYRLGESWYSVKAGDFIWMAPYCPQWFGALGKTPARYLIYKDWNRHPLA